MKCHSGVDAGSGYVYSLEVTAANVHDITVATKLIREDDEVVYGDAGYLGIEKREEVSSDKHLSSIDYRINRRVGSVQKVPLIKWVIWGFAPNNPFNQRFPNTLCPVCRRGKGKSWPPYI